MRGTEAASGILDGLYCGVAYKDRSIPGNRSRISQDFSAKMAENEKILFMLESMV